MFDKKVSKALKKQLAKDIKKKKLLLERIPDKITDPKIPTQAINECKEKKISINKKKKLKKLKKQLKKDDEIIDNRQLVSIALPGSILGNAQTLELQTFLAGQIARAAAIFRIEEIIIFHEQDQKKKCAFSDVADMNFHDYLYLLEERNSAGYHTILLAYLLDFMECPQYLRKMLYPKVECLSKTGSLPPLATDSHVADSDQAIYREGCVLQGVSSDGQKHFDPKTNEVICDLVNVGVHESVQINEKLPPYTRVTVRMNKYLTKKSNKKTEEKEEEKEKVEEKPMEIKQSATVVKREEPSIKEGLNWGYRVRVVEGLTSALKVHPYDIVIGTSDRGSSVDDYQPPQQWRHALIVFGGVQGLEYSMVHDPKCDTVESNDLFHHYINTCPRQGSRTIRTEEAIFITLSALRPKLMPWSASV